MKISEDQIGRSIELESPPRRIVSLVPSQTEFLLDIGAPVVGRTSYCIHPASMAEEIPIVGGTKNFRIDKIQELAPDLIVGNKEENSKSGIQKLMTQFPTWISDVKTLHGAFDMMQTLGEVCEYQKESQRIIADCREALHKVKATQQGSAIYMIWKDPWMAAGKGTFIDEIMQHLGYRNAVKEERYPQISSEVLQDLDVDHVLLSSEPFPFEKRHSEEMRNLKPHSQISIVDGELFSWYGSRLRKWYDYATS
ncbi:MAG: helical backbone metal receptor [Bacteroidota bacterium]